MNEFLFDIRNYMYMNCVCNWQKGTLLMPHWHTNAQRGHSVCAPKRFSRDSLCSCGCISRNFHMLEGDHSFGISIVGAIVPHNTILLPSHTPMRPKAHFNVQSRITPHCCRQRYCTRIFIWSMGGGGAAIRCFFWERHKKHPYHIPNIADQHLGAFTVSGAL